MAATIATFTGVLNHPSTSTALARLCGLSSTALLGRAVDLVPERRLEALIRERVITEARILHPA
jgi:predicted nucleotidyltransferase